MAGEQNWSCAIAEHHGAVVGVWPYQIKTTMGLRHLGTPPLTPYVGPWYVIPKSLEKRLSQIKFVNRVFKKFLEQIPLKHTIRSFGHHRLPYWLFLHWNGFRSETRYTHELDVSKPTDDLWNALESKQRNSIRAGKEMYEAVEGESIDQIIPLVRSSFRRKSVEKLLSIAIENKLRKLDDQLKVRNKRRILLAQDASGEIHGGIYLVSDHRTEYLLLSGYKANDVGAQGAIPLLIWHSIKTTREEIYWFDFEGGNIPSIGKFFQSFGATPKPYHYLYRFDNRFMEFLFRVLNRI